MDFVFTVTFAEPGRAAELRTWLRHEEPAWESALELIDGPDGGVMRFRGPRAEALVRYAQVLMAWLNERGPNAPALTLAVETPRMRRSVELTGQAADRDTLARLVSELTAAPEPGPVTGIQVTGGTHYMGPARHTSPGPVLDPDDDWDRE
ncbi:hypothetical protein ACWCV9_20515 [Streptomyces sp. NPDC001606]